MGRQQIDARQRQHDGTDFIEGWPAVKTDALDKENEDRRKVLQDRSDGGRRKLNRTEVQILAQADAQKSVDNQLEAVILSLPDFQCLPAVMKEAVQEKNDARSSETNRHEPVGIHAFDIKQVLSHTPGKTPADAAHQRQKCSFYVFAHVGNYILLYTRIAVNSSYTDTGRLFF